MPRQYIIHRRDVLKAAGALVTVAIPALSSADPLDAARLHSKSNLHFGHNGWPFDAYPDQDLLNAKHSMIVADLRGPGVIRRFHISEPGAREPFHPADAFGRGVIVEIYYDHSTLPSVCVPLSDFFLDGTRQAKNFSTPTFEKFPKGYFSFVQMPFREAAKVVLRNDLAFDLTAYAFIEWEKMDAWDRSLGYFHATWKRDVFQLGPDTEREFLHINAEGHLFGRSETVVTDEPLFDGFTYVMEGNNEFRIDDAPLEINYLGSEDAFGMSWGWSEAFIGEQHGTTFVQQSGPSTVSTYYFWDPAGVPFRKNIDLRVSWKDEFKNNKIFDTTEFQRQLRARNAANGCWVDYASTFYWYQRQVGFVHAPLPAVEDRLKSLMRSSV